MFARFLIPLMVLCSSVQGADRVQISGQTMGTYYAVTVDGPDEGLTENSLRNAVDARLREINRQMSTWDSESEISRFNQSKSTDWHAISRDFLNVINESVRVYELTSGAFDPTVSPLIDLWGFGKPGRRNVVPGETAIAAALTHVGLQQLEVRQEPAAIRRKNSELQINLSAIAKGYAVDAVAEILIERGQLSWIVDIGGETRAGKAKINGDPWTVGIERPDATGGDSRDLLRIIPMTDQAVATSGDYRNFFEVNGLRYSHTINPTTGYPLKTPPASVTVLHRSCATADALATAMMVLGQEQGKKVAAQHDLSVLFQIYDGQGQSITTATGEFVQDDSAAAESLTDRIQSTVLLFIAAGVIFALALTGMAIGVLLRNREIKGSCGGLASMPGSEGKSICDLCSVPREKCVNEDLRQQMLASEDQHPDRT